MDSTWTASLHSAPQAGFWLMIRGVHVCDVAAGTAKIQLQLPQDSKNEAFARLSPTLVARATVCGLPGTLHNIVVRNPPAAVDRIVLFATIPCKPMRCLRSAGVTPTGSVMRDDQVKP